MELWRSLEGMIQLKLTSAALEDLLNTLNGSNLTLYDVQFTNELTCYVKVKRQDINRIYGVCSRKNADVSLVGTCGLYWYIMRLFHRPVLAAALVVFLIITFYLPTRVLFLKVEGNYTVPSRKILEAASDCGIHFGSSRKTVRSEQVKNRLLESVEELQWVGINTRGTVATISVRERNQSTVPVSKVGAGNIVAAREGYILSATASRGDLLVQPGQTVSTGEMLISGYRYLGICVQATQADGEVLAQTNRKIQAKMPLNYVIHANKVESYKKISVLYGKKRINLWKDSGISGSTCGRMYLEYYVTLPGGFSLPFALCIDTYYVCDHENLTSDEDFEQSSIVEYTKNYLLQQMIAGQIVSASVESLEESNCCGILLDCICHEMIGVFRQEQIGDRNG